MHNKKPLISEKHFLFTPLQGGVPVRPAAAV
jgi:hypothetical protein